VRGAGAGLGVGVGVGAASRLLTGRARETGAWVAGRGAAAADGAETGRTTGWLSSTTFLRCLPFLPDSGFAAGFAAAATTGWGRVFLPPRRFGGGGGGVRLALAIGAEAGRGGGGGGGPWRGGALAVGAGPETGRAGGCGPEAAGAGPETGGAAACGPEAAGAGPETGCAAACGPEAAGAGPEAGCAAACGPEAAGAGPETGCAAACGPEAAGVGPEAGCAAACGPEAAGAGPEMGVRCDVRARGRGCGAQVEECCCVRARGRARGGASGGGGARVERLRRVRGVGLGARVRARGRGCEVFWRLFGRGRAVDLGGHGLEQRGFDHRVEHGVGEHRGARLAVDGVALAAGAGAEHGDVGVVVGDAEDEAAGGFGVEVGEVHAGALAEAGLEAGGLGDVLVVPAAGGLGFCVELEAAAEAAATGRRRLGRGGLGGAAAHGEGEAAEAADQRVVVGGRRGLGLGGVLEDR
jgi:hypothetical protein